MFQRMPGIHIATLFKIPVYIHFTWFFIFLMFTLTQATYFEQFGLTTTAAYFLGGLTTIVIFATLLAHEFGHALAARTYGIETEKITLFMLGGVAEIREEPRRPMEEFVVAIAGPVVSVVCMILFGVLAYGASLAGTATPMVQALSQVAILNLVFAVFNMLPGFPMDGGRVVRAAVWAITGNFLQATKIAFLGGVSIACLLIVGGLTITVLGLGNGLFMMLIGGFLIFLSWTAYKNAKMKTAFESYRVHQLMRPVQAVVPSHLTVREVVDQYIHRIHADRFPVVDGSSLLGYISANDIARISREDWDTIPVFRLIKPYNQREILSPDLSLMTAFQRMGRSGIQQCPVFRGKTLVGYLTLSDVIFHLRNIGSRTRGA